MQFEEIVKTVATLPLSAAPVVVSNTTPKGIQIDGADLRAVCKFLQEHELLYFDMLSCITGLDNGPATGTMEVVYTLYSIPYHLHLNIKVMLDRGNPAIDSISDIWRTANWQEREIFDLLGITFNNHPDLRRILLPADWDGHPLRKDYKQQEYYRSIKLDY